MKDTFVTLLIVAAIICVCGLYFKTVILNWLGRDAELRKLNDAPGESPVAVHH
jgi:hypothetical protein